MINKIGFSEYMYLFIYYLDFRILRIWKGDGDRGMIFLERWVFLKWFEYKNCF